MNDTKRRTYGHCLPFYIVSVSRSRMLLHAGQSWNALPYADVLERNPIIITDITSWLPCLEGNHSPVSFLENAMRIANKRCYTASCYCCQHFTALLRLAITSTAVSVNARNKSRTGRSRLSACFIAETSTTVFDQIRYWRITLKRCRAILILTHFICILFRIRLKSDKFSQIPAVNSTKST
jgi:hypothetical protein